VSFENSGPESENSTSVEVTLVDDVKAELSEIDSSDLSEHSARFEALHGKLQEALSTIDGL
jgi:hypothetical protein